MALNRTLWLIIHVNGVSTVVADKTFVSSADADAKLATLQAAFPANVYVKTSIVVDVLADSEVELDNDETVSFTSFAYFSTEETVALTALQKQAWLTGSQIALASVEQSRSWLLHRRDVQNETLPAGEDVLLDALDAAHNFGATDLILIGR